MVLSDAEFLCSDVFSREGFGYHDILDHKKNSWIINIFIWNSLTLCGPEYRSTIINKLIISKEEFRH